VPLARNSFYVYQKWLAFFIRHENMNRVTKMLIGNRNKLQIMAEILGKLRDPTSKTNIMFHCNMSSMQSGQYLNLMGSSDLVRKEDMAGKVTYQRTETGRKFLEAYAKMILLIDPSIPAPFLV
jgi:predicted transcriptional regulator